MSDMDMEGMEERGKGDMGMETRGHKEKGMDMLNPGIPNFQERWVYTVLEQNIIFAEGYNDFTFYPISPPRPEVDVKWDF